MYHHQIDTAVSKDECAFYGMAKGTSQVEATLNIEKIKPVALVIVELCWSEGIN